MKSPGLELSLVARANKPQDGRRVQKVPDYILAGMIDPVLDELKFSVPESRTEAKARLPRLHLLHGNERRKHRRSPIGPGRLHERALYNFLHTLHVISVLAAHTQSLQSTNIDEPENTFDINAEIALIYTTILELRGGEFASERKLIIEFLKGIGLDDVDELIPKRPPVHQLTGYTNQFRTSAAVALAHDFALYTNKEVVMVFGDISNVGGTNQYFEQLLYSKAKMDQKLRGTLPANTIDPDDPKAIRERKKLAMRLCDWSVRILCETVKDVFWERLGEERYKHVQFLGVGGDEFYITAPGSVAEIKSVLEEANLRLITVVKDLGLDAHAHSKPGKKTKGLGISFSYESLLKVGVTLEELTTKSHLSSAAANNGHFDPEKHRVNYPILRDLIVALKTNSYYARSEPKPAGLRDHRSSEETVPVDFKDRIRYIFLKYLYGLSNPIVGLEDISVLPGYLFQLQKESQAKEFDIINIALENIAAINDKLNHETANKILKEVAQKLKVLCRSFDPRTQLFSAGGGKFVGLIPNKTHRAFKIDRSFQLHWNEFEKRSAEVVSRINRSEVIANDGHLVQVGALANPKRPKELGLSLAMTSCHLDPFELEILGKGPLDIVEELWLKLDEMVAKQRASLE